MTQETNREENTYKRNASEEGEENELVAKEVKEEVDAVMREVKNKVDKLSDPLVQASLMYTVRRERENTNLILKNIYARLEQLEEKIRKLAETSAGRIEAPMLLSEVDEQIIAFVKVKRKACAEEVQKQFKYKGRNAASARLNALFTQGMLEKAQVGRKVYYLPVQ